MVLPRARRVGRRLLGARQHPRPLAVEGADRAAPGVARSSLVAHGELLPESDAGLEEIDGDRLLAGIQLVGAPGRRDRDDTDGSEQPAAARDVDLFGDKAGLGDHAEEAHHHEGGRIGARAGRGVVEVPPAALQQ